LLLRLVEQRLGDARSRNVLDVGCGIGVVDAELVSSVGDLHGIDTSQKSLEEAARAVPSARFRHFGGKRIPHAAAAFDLVFAICVLHHLPPQDRPAFVAEMASVTRPGGIVAIIEHNPLNPMTCHIVSRCAFDRDAVLLRCGTGLRLLAGAGLERGGRGYIAFWPQRTAFIERVEQRIEWLPAGAQYYVWATKGPAGAAIPSRPAPRRPS
jgi:SAM-dependent methyltransferase